MSNNTRRPAKFSVEQSFVVRLDALRREFDYNRGGGRLQFETVMREAMKAVEAATYAYRRANPFCEHCGAIGAAYDNHVEQPCAGLRAVQQQEEEYEGYCDGEAARRAER